MDFTKALDSVAQYIATKAEQPWNQRRYLAVVKELPYRQFVRINGCDSDTHIITQGVPQGSVLGPKLFSLFTKDLPKSLHSAETYLYADDTTIYCIEETIDLLTNTPNNVLAELQEWCDRNLLLPHPEKCKAMIMQRK